MDDIVGKFQSLPLFTRAWLGLSIIVTAAVTLDVIHINQVVLDWGRIIPYNKILNSIGINVNVNVNQYRGGSGGGSKNVVELWRLLTSFCYVGKFDQFNSLFLLFTIYVHSKGYEKNPFPAGSGSRTADSLFGIIFCVICLLITQPIPGYLFGTTYALYPIMTRNLTGSLLYLWSKRNPRVMIQLNFIPMEGRYLPFAHIGASLFMKNRLHELLHGFLIGHIYYFLIEVAPILMGGKRILHTPRILVELLGEYVENAIQQNNNNDNNNNNSNGAIFRDRDGATQAHILAKLGNLPHLRQISNTNIGILDVPDRNGWKPLHEATRGGFVEIVKFLIVEQHLDVHETTNSGQSCLSIARENHVENHPVTRFILRIIAADDNNHNDDDDDDDDDDDNENENENESNSNNDDNDTDVDDDNNDDGDGDDDNPHDDNDDGVGRNI
jgi:hypothetical protein